MIYFCAHVLPRAWRTLNTDFPNYYLSSRLVHEGYDTSRIYEWPWIEREKDHRGIDVRTIGLLPITPFSTLAVYPLVKLSPLAAKHFWILLNLAFLIPIGWILRSMTGLSYQRIALALLLSVPLHKNLLFGQFYVLLLLLILGACWSYLRGFRVLAGALLAIAAVCKIFPVLLFVFFLRRREWLTLASGAVTGIASVSLSIVVFGWSAHRTWLLEILPWVTHGEGLPPYVATASISSVLHCLFLNEPQWNPHPWHPSVLAYALLMPTLQMLVFAPAVLLIRRQDKTPSRVLSEWSGILTASLAISTIPASYNFVLMAFPFCVLAATLLRRQQFGWLSALVIAYLGIGFPLAVPATASGLGILLYVPRLPLMLAVLWAIYSLQWHDREEQTSTRDWAQLAWATAMIVSVIFSIRSTLHLQRAAREEYVYRLPSGSQGFLNSSPQATGRGVSYSAFTMSGYHLLAQDDKGTPNDSGTDTSFDELSFGSGLDQVWVERASNPHSQIVDKQRSSTALVDDARDPMLSADGQRLAFLRDDHGRGQLMVRGLTTDQTARELALTPKDLNVYEASYISEKAYAFSAEDKGSPPQIYATDASHLNAPLMLGESRYPSLSPDGKWMAYSHFSRGVWNLWLRNQATGEIRRIADVPCNQIQPAWKSDSKNLLYGTDCGRSLWFTAIASRQVIP